MTERSYQICLSFYTTKQVKIKWFPVSFLSINEIQKIILLLLTVWGVGGSRLYLIKLTLALICKLKVQTRNKFLHNKKTLLIV